MCYYIIILSENSLRERYAWAKVAGEKPKNRSGVKVNRKRFRLDYKEFSTFNGKSNR